MRRPPTESIASAPTQNALGSPADPTAAPGLRPVRRAAAPAQGPAADGGDCPTLPEAVRGLRQALSDASHAESAPTLREVRCALATVSTAAGRVLVAVDKELSAAGDGLLLGLWLASTHRHLTIYPRRQMVEHHGRRHVLTRTEWQLLDALLTHAGEPLPRRTLADLAWGTSPVDRSQNVEVYVSRLRRKVEVDPQRPELIKTVRGVGYLLSQD